jgi:uncharacterized membrane protein
MFLRLLLIGSVVGALSGIVALILGSSIWMGLLIYSSVGTFSVVAIAALVVLSSDAGREAEAPRDFSPVPRG